MTKLISYYKFVKINGQVAKFKEEKIQIR